MYYAIVEILLETARAHSESNRPLHNLCHKIRSRFKATCSFKANTDGDSTGSIVFCLLTETENEINNRIDKIIDLVENEGIGVIEAEFSLIGHISQLREE